MSVTGKVFLTFRPRLSFSLIAKSSRTCAVYSTKSVLNCYSTWNNPLRLELGRKTISKINSQVRTMSALSPLDPSSFSRPEITLVKHISLSLNVDFEKKILNGSTVLTVEVLKDTNEVILDTSNLTIESIEAEDGSALQYNLAEEIPNYGSKLTVTLPKTASTGENNVTDKVLNASKCTSMSLAFTGLMYQPDMYDTEMVSSDANDECCKTCGRSLKNKSNKNIPGHERGNNIADCVKAQSASKGTSMSLTFTGLMYRPIVSDTDMVSSDAKDGNYCVTCGRSQKNKNSFKDNSRVSGHDRGVKIKIKYATAPSASGLQWLEPSQTSGKQHPYLFSQCQPIHARSIMPCQDTPAVKFTYDAEVTAPAPFTVLMSALRGANKGVSTAFRQPVPVPSYLLAIAVGVLESRQLGPRSLVWSEKEEIERSAWEFADTEKYLQAAERLCGQYVWGQYDLLVLPPSFPYGGMENPCLTFVTPTLLAGDRSQADVIVHEIMHSWTGNLVTNRNFEHFWLNEGFTVFLERKVGASLIADAAEAKRSRDFHSLLGLQELSETVHDHFSPASPLTKLVVDLNGVHPDDAFSRVPYEKGSLFLRYLEDLAGGPEVFDDFLRAYLNQYKRKSLDTDQFKNFLLNYFKDNENLKTVDWNAWLYTSGMPPIIPNYDTSMTKAITSLLGKIEQPNATLSYDDVKAFTPHQIINLLQELIDRPPLSQDKVRTLGETYKVNNSTNSEILYRWLRLCVRSKELEKLPEVFNFVNHQGRMKYVRPIYRDLYAWEDVRQQAIDNFLANEKYMMHVSAYTLRKDLHLNS